jgi:hypothetical protein
MSDRIMATGRSVEETYHVDGARGVRWSKSGKALFCTAVDLGAGAWIPVSQLQPDSEIQKPGDRGLLVVGGWFAEKAGWL